MRENKNEERWLFLSAFLMRCLAAEPTRARLSARQKLDSVSVYTTGLRQAHRFALKLGCVSLRDFVHDSFLPLQEVRGKLLPLRKTRRISH
jgi:hypothetical protein